MALSSERWAERSAVFDVGAVWVTWLCALAFSLPHVLVLYHASLPPLADSRGWEVD